MSGERKRSESRIALSHRASPRLYPYAYFCATNFPTKIDSQRLPVT
jgi:hypothetical protein